MNKLTLTGSPHIRGNAGVKKIMLDVIIALMPALIAGCIFFGLRALMVVAIAVASAVAAEYLYKLIFFKKSFGKKALTEVTEEFDLTSVITGLLLGLNLSSLVEWYIPVIGSFFAVIVVKMMFGGTGRNLFNPAIAGRVFLYLSFTSVISGFAMPDRSNVLVTGATALTNFLKNGNIGDYTLWNLFFGACPGSIGETSVLAILIGGIYLIVKKVIDFRWPLIYIAVTGLVGVALEGFDFAAFLPLTLGGGLVLGAFFMANDYVTTPNTKVGNYVYFILLGLLTAILRWYKSAEYVSFAIMIMNMLVPLIDRFIIQRPFGSEPIRPFKKLKEKRAAKIAAASSAEVKN